VFEDARDFPQAAAASGSVELREPRCRATCVVWAVVVCLFVFVVVAVMHNWCDA
jgi:hypothetical protein